MDFGIVTDWNNSTARSLGDILRLCCRAAILIVIKILLLELRMKTSRNVRDSELCWWEEHRTGCSKRQAYHPAGRVHDEVVKLSLGLIVVTSSGRKPQRRQLRSRA